MIFPGSYWVIRLVAAGAETKGFIATFGHKKIDFFSLLLSSFWHGFQGLFHISFCYVFMLHVFGECIFATFGVQINYNVDVLHFFYSAMDLKFSPQISSLFEDCCHFYFLCHLVCLQSESLMSKLSQKIDQQWYPFCYSFYEWYNSAHYSRVELHSPKSINSVQTFNASYV